MTETTRRIVVLSDSFALPFGGTATSWPKELAGTLEDRLGPGTETTVLCRNLQTVSLSLRRHAGKLRALQPDVVVIAHGGTEARIKFPAWLDRRGTLADADVEAKPEPGAAPGEDGGAATAGRPSLRARVEGGVRHLGRSGYSAVLAASPPGFERAMARLGIAPRGEHLRFTVDLAVLVAGLLEGTSADVVLVKMVGGRQTTLANYSPRLKRADNDAVDAVARLDAKRVTVHELTGVDVHRHTIVDGVHFNDAGHAVVAAELAEVVTARLSARGSLTTQVA
jgi:lysophospholipase L1-like esterase